MKTNKEDYSFMIAFYLKDVLLPGEQLKDSKSNTIILFLLCYLAVSYQTLLQKFEVEQVQCIVYNNEQRPPTTPHPTHTTPICDTLNYNIFMIVLVTVDNLTSMSIVM